MKFAANGTLYRGSKPVMWSVVEKTALAEAEVEYEDYTSDTVWVKFPIREQEADSHSRLGTGETARRSCTRDAYMARRIDRHLDDDALDDSWQSSDQLFAEDRIWTL